GRAPRRGPSTSAIVSGVITVVALALIAIYALTHSQSPSKSSSGEPALTTASDYNPTSSQIGTGGTAPTFTLKDLSGTSYRLAAQRGHPVLLEFYAVWCPVCQGEAPVIAQITKTFVPRGVRVWSILANPYGKNYESSGESDLSPATKSDVQWFRRTFKVTHPELIDPNFHVVNRYGIGAYPGIVILDKTGKIIFSQAGHQDYATLAKQINTALKGAAS